MVTKSNSDLKRSLSLSPQGHFNDCRDYFVSNYFRTFFQRLFLISFCFMFSKSLSRLFEV